MIETIAATGSTNADLAARLAGGEAIPDAFWLRAERQSAGKGRAGRVWQGEAGNLFCSTLVNLHPGDPSPATLALVAGLAAHDALAEAKPLLKWPNDLLIGGAKVAGILCEMVGQAVIVGIGVNVAAAPALPDRATTALADHGDPRDAAAVLEALAAAFAMRLARWRAAPLSDTLAAWEARATPRGTPISVHAEGPAHNRVTGACEGLADDGSLRLRLADGTIRAIYAGDVIVEKP